MAFSYTWPAPKFKIRTVGKFSDGRQIFSWPAGRKNFGRTGAKFSDGRMETIRTDGRKNFRTDGKFSVGRKKLGRTEKIWTGGRKNSDGKVEKMQIATFWRIQPNVPGFISKPFMKRTFPGTFVEILPKVAGAIFGKMLSEKCFYDNLMI